MIDEMLIFSFKKWFNDYVNAIKNKNINHKNNIEIKLNHTLRVCFEILDIGKSIGLKQDDLNIAEIIALFHDLGRFEQIVKYGTFDDGKSVDHAVLGKQILNSIPLFNELNPDIREIINNGILNHNKLTIQKTDNEKEILFIKLIRDADKLDILRLFSEHYYDKSVINDGAMIELGLPDIPDISDEVYLNVINLKPVKYSNLKTLAEFKLLKFSWIYDINFFKSFQLIKERGYLNTIYDTLPRSDKVDNVYFKISDFLDTKILNKNN